MKYIQLNIIKDKDTSIFILMKHIESNIRFFNYFDDAQPGTCILIYSL